MHPQNEIYVTSLKWKGSDSSSAVNLFFQMQVSTNRLNYPNGQGSVLLILKYSFGKWRSLRTSETQKLVWAWAAFRRTSRHSLSITGVDTEKYPNWWQKSLKHTAHKNNAIHIFDMRATLHRFSHCESYCKAYVCTASFVWTRQMVATSDASARFRCFHELSAPIAAFLSGRVAVAAGLSRRSAGHFRPADAAGNDAENAPMETSPATRRCRKSAQTFRARPRQLGRRPPRRRRASGATQGFRDSALLLVHGMSFLVCSKASLSRQGFGCLREIVELGDQAPHFLIFINALIFDGKNP